MLVRVPFAWTLGTPLREEPDEELDEDDECFSEPYIQAKDPVLETILPFRKGDRFYVIRPEFSFPLSPGMTLRQLIGKVSQFLLTRVDRSVAVEEEISKFYEPWQAKLWEKLEKEELIYNDLLGNHVFMNQEIIRKNNGDWYFPLGS